MIKVLLYLWQLPQNLLGLALVKILKARRQCLVFYTDKYLFGVSLGNYIIFGGNWTETDLRHEMGHQKQSRYLGIFYLLIIGLPSLLGNLYDRVFHKSWNNQKRIDWYYSQPWEAWADKLGGVIRWQYGKEYQCQKKALRNGRKPFLILKKA